MSKNEDNTTIAMSFDEALAKIGVDAILQVLMLSHGRGNNGYPASEKAFFDTFTKALQYASKYEIHRQYSVDKGKYFIDCLLVRTDVTVFEDDTKETNIHYTIIEYDEKYHDIPLQALKDKQREDDIKLSLQKLAKSQHYDNIRISIVRIKEGQEHLAYLYLLPYLTGIDTSYCFDKLCDTLDFRYLLSYDD